MKTVRPVSAFILRNQYKDSPEYAFVRSLTEHLTKSQEKYKDLGAITLNDGNRDELETIQHIANIVSKRIGISDSQLLGQNEETTLFYPFNLCKLIRILNELLIIFEPS